MPEVAAEIAVPLPFNIPVTDVAIVSDGAEPPDDVPENPFAEATEIAVTEPAPGAVQLRLPEPSVVSTYVFVPAVAGHTILYAPVAAEVIVVTLVVEELAPIRTTFVACVGAHDCARAKSGTNKNRMSSVSFFML